MVNDRDDVPTGNQDVSSSIPDRETSAAYQDGSSSDATLFTGPTDEGSTNLGPGLTEGGTGTEINTEGDITKGGMGGTYGYGGTTVGGTGSGGIGTTGEGIPPKPEGDFEV
jgi:hypothetical protein